VLGIILLLVVAAVTLFGVLVITVARRGLDQYQERYLTQGSRDLTEMFVFVDDRQLLVLTVAVSAIFGLLGYALVNWFVGVVAVAFGFIAPFQGIRVLRQRRIRKFEQQLVDALAQLSAALRAGLSFAQAAETVSQEMPSPLSQEFGLFVKELKLGVDMEQALQNMAERVGSEDLHLMTTATVVSKQLGGNMAEMFEIIAATIRERFRLEGRIRALTAQGKLQGWIVGAMPLVLGLILNYMRPDLMEPMLESTFGAALVATVITMEVIGIWLIRRVVSIDV
jgi:tight adherence protein B